VGARRDVSEDSLDGDREDVAAAGEAVESVGQIDGVRAGREDERREGDEQGGPERDRRRRARDPEREESGGRGPLPPRRGRRAGVGGIESERAVRPPALMKQDQEGPDRQPDPDLASELLLRRQT